MKRFFFIVIAIVAYWAPLDVHAQVNEDELGAWYMYFFDATFKEGPWGIQGDVQYRDWQIAGDLSQLLIRGGLSYKPQKAAIKFTLGYGNITTGAFGSNRSTFAENRIYQEALFPVKISSRFLMNHRFRYEQRFVENQDFRTRYRYNLFLNIPLNNVEMDAKTYYLSFYNEIFINGQREIGGDRQVELFDRNRFYAALGYMIKKGIKIQLGVMNQSTDIFTMNQLQLSFHQSL